MGVARMAIDAGRVALPDLDSRAWDRRTRGIEDAAEDMGHLSLRLRGFADDAHEIVVGVAAPIGRIEGPFGLRRGGDELLLGGARGADIRHQRRRGDRREAAHHVAASKLRRQYSAHRILVPYRCWWVRPRAPTTNATGSVDIPSPPHPAASTAADGCRLTRIPQPPEPDPMNFPTLPPQILPIVLLSISNIFMTFAWYGHLRFKEQPLVLVIVVAWLIAFFEYCLAVPANRWGNAVYSAAELKTMQEVITLSVFAVFSVAVPEGADGLSQVIGFGFIAAGRILCLLGQGLKRIRSRPYKSVARQPRGDPMAETRIALVTGANRGIGLEIVKQLSRAGLMAVLARATSARAARRRPSWPPRVSSRRRSRSM